jgi:Glucosamine 6-phosphate synthetase, contains amidotransferase and phosphosugar isomerase domains
MCGIFGVIANNQCSVKESDLIKGVNELAKRSESRGKDSSGIAILNENLRNIDVFKSPYPITNLIKKNIVADSIRRGFLKNNFIKLAFGHSRLVTNGTQLSGYNNQPIVKDKSICIHNGIIVNHNNLWKKYPILKKEYEIDTEVLLAIINYKIKLNIDPLDKIISDSVNEVFGTIATAILLTNLKKFVLTTNNGSLYTVKNKNDYIFFASEMSIMNAFSKKIGLHKKQEFEIEQLNPNTGIIIDLYNFSFKKFNYGSSDKKINSESINTKSISIKSKI